MCTSSQPNRFVIDGATSGQAYYKGTQLFKPMRGTPSITITAVAEVGGGFNGITTGSITAEIVTIYGFRWSVAATASDSGTNGVGCAWEADAEL